VHRKKCLHAALTSTRPQALAREASDAVVPVKAGDYMSGAKPYFLRS